MKTFKNTKKEIRTEKTGKFSGFFLNAPMKEKIEIFTEAAEKANHDQ